MISQPAAKSRTFITRFAGDGRYLGAVSLDLPFVPQQLGVFAGGNFLIAGIDRTLSEPRAAIVGANGQLIRLLEMNEDVRLREESSEPLQDGSRRSNANDPSALPRFSSSSADSLVGAISGSRITQAGPNLLLYRQMNGPIFLISPSGEVRVHKLKVDSSYHIYAVMSARDFWIVEFMREIPPHGPAIEFAMFAFDPKTDVPVREYFFPSDLGWGLACTDGDEFTFVTADDQTKSLKLVNLTAAGAAR